MKKLLLISIVIFYSKNGFTGTFTSVSNGSWNNPLTWSYIGDADGIPDYDDDVTIDVGHTITNSGTQYGNNVIVNGSLNLGNSSSILYIRGNYTVNGSETGTGGIGFTYNTSAIISGGGTFGTSVKYSFSASKTIAAGTVISKASNTPMSIAGNVTLTNNGTYTIGSVTAGSNSVIQNKATGILYVNNYYHISSSVTIDAQEAGNVVHYNFTNSSGLIKSPLNGIFHHLVISGATTKSLQTSVTVNGNFVAQSGCGFNFRNLNMNVKGNFVMGSSLYTQQTGSILTLDGTSAQNFVCTGAAVTNIPNLVINNPAGVNTTGGIIRIANYLEVQAGNFNAGSNYITLLSNATSTARIAQSNGTMSGTMTIQRYVSGRGDGYSDMSSPTSNATFAQLSDDFEMIFTAYAPPYNYVPSAWGYDETAWDYFAIETSGTAMTPGVGYEVYLDNDGDTTTTFVATTIDIVGTPNMGDVSVPVTVNNDGWNLVGNPYASHIDWATFRTNAGISMNSTFMFYDEAISDFNTGTLGDVIAQSQGFWIEATTAGNAVFHENNKTTSTSSSFRSAEEPLFSLRVSSSEVQFTSNTYFRFDENADENYLAEHDLTFVKVPVPKAPSLYSRSSDGKNLRINELFAEKELVVPVDFKAGFNGNYTISVLNFESALNEGYDVIILEDKKTGIYYNLTASPYDFGASTEDEPNRFNVHFRKSDMMEMELSEILFSQSTEGVFVHFDGVEDLQATISVFNLAGQEIISSRLVNTSVNVERVETPVSYHGIYIVRVIMSDKIYTCKFYKP